MNFTETESWAIINALNVAAQQYLKDADAMRADPNHARGGLVRQFEDQSTLVLALAARIEEAI